MKVALAAALCALVAATAAAAEAPQPGVLVIGDSVATGMLWHPPAIAVMQRGYDVEWEVAICRTTAGEGCPFEGARPPSLLDVVNARATVPPTVVVVTGYNDAASTFAGSVDEAVDALVARGATRVIWLTLREAEAPFPLLNADLVDAVTRHPQLYLADWDALAARHRDWFQDDGVHLTAQGGIAMAHLAHGAVTETLDPLRAVTTSLPPVRQGRRYAAALRFAGGTPPYRVELVAGRLRRGLTLHAEGRITGVARGVGRLRFQVRVTDADGIDTLVQYGAR